jgi:hypothetical protein
MYSLRAHRQYKNMMFERYILVMPAPRVHLTMRLVDILFFAMHMKVKE